MTHHIITRPPVVSASEKKESDKFLNEIHFQHLIEAYVSTKSFDELLLHCLIFGDMQESFTKTKH